MFRAFHVFLYLQKHCKYQHFLWSTRQKCCNLQCFFLCFQKHWYLQCFVHLGSKKYWYLQHFLRFCMAPAKDGKTQKCCNLQHFVTFENRKIVRKMCQNGTFFSDFRTSKTHLQISPSFCPPQTPKNVKTPAPWRISKKVGGTGAPPRVAKARISYHQATASPEWANALVPPTPFSGRSGGERSKRPTCAVVQTCKCYRVFEGLGSVNIDCGTMNRMYWYQGFPWLFMECCFHILGMVCLASLA